MQGDFMICLTVSPDFCQLWLFQMLRVFILCFPEQLMYVIVMFGSRVLFGDV